MKYLLFICLSLLITNNLFSQNQEHQLDSTYSKLYIEGAFNGNVLIADRGKIIFEKSYGLANEQTREKLNSKSIFELASVSKQFTAAAIFLLKKKGSLSLEDPLHKYIPELSFYREITIRNLLNHSSGLPDYMKLMDEKWDHLKIASNKDVISLMAKYQPAVLFAANSKFEYSNTGYVLLATIIERVSHQSYPRFMKENIFVPFGLKNTEVISRYQLKRPFKNLTVGYLEDSLGRKITPQTDRNLSLAFYLDGIYGPGRIFSTAQDLFKWDRILATDKFVSAADKLLIYAPQILSDGKKSEYGFGWKLDSENKLFGNFVYHDGGWGGYINFFERHLVNDKTIIILQNNFTKKTRTNLKNVRKIIYHLPIENRIALDTAIMQKYTGSYKDADAKATNIVFEMGKLYVQMNSKVKMELVPLSANRFIVDGFSPDVIYEFKNDESGAIKKLKVLQRETGIDSESIKVK